MTERREIPFGRPWIDDEDRAAVDRVLHGHILTHGPECKAFEAEFAAFMGPPATALSMSSCMAALHMAYVNAGIGPGDEVIVAAQTHVATAHAVEFVGARPVFVDCDPQTGNVTADRIAPLVTSKTKAIGLVHFCGIPCDMQPIMELANKHGLKVIEDCAIAIGSRIGNTHVGLFGDVGCYSFYPVKHITTGEGGMLVSKNAETVAKIGKIRAFGVDRSNAGSMLPGMYEVTQVGINYRMSEMSAALGRTQVKKLPEILRKRAANFAVLKDRLGSVPGVRVLDGTRSDTTNSHYCAVTVLEDDALGAKREQIVRAINERGIGTSVYYPAPVPRMQYYREKYGYDAARFANAAKISDHGFALPVGPHLTEDDIRYVGDALASVVEEARK